VAETRILFRAGRAPFEPAEAVDCFKRNLIANNTGNLLFAQSVFRAIYNENTRIDCTYKVPTDPDRINAEYDAYVIPLANAFRPSFMAYLERLTSLVEKLTIPVVVVGVGAQTDLGLSMLQGTSPVDQVASKFVAAVLKRSASIGVRGEITREYLEKLGFKDVETIGCPSMYMTGGKLDVVKKVPSLQRDDPIAANLTPRMPPNVADLFRRTWKSYPELTYVAQDKADMELMMFGKPILTNKKGDAFPNRIAHPLLLENRTRLFIDPRTWMSMMRRQMLSFGTRIHGNVIALLAGTPAVVVAHDSRTLELAQFYRIPYIKSQDVNAETTVEELYESADFTEMVRGHEDRFRNFVAFLEKNGLRHNYGESGSTAAFDERLANAELAAPVVPITAMSKREQAMMLTFLHGNPDIAPATAP